MVLSTISFEYLNSFLRLLNTLEIIEEIARQATNIFHLLMYKLV